MSKTDDVSRNLKLDHLTDLGLEFFTGADKFGSELKNGTLESILLNDESVSYSIADPIDDSFDTFPDYVPHDMPSLSPTNENTELIEVFPTIDSMLLVPGVRSVDVNKTPAIMTKNVNDIEKIRTHRTYVPVNVISPAKNRKVRRLIKQPKLKKNKSDCRNFPEMKKYSPTGFSGNFNDNTELDNKINDTLLDILQAKTDSSQMPVTDYSRPRLKEKRSPNDYIKFITILPPKSDGKIINLMVRGKSCRSKQQLTESELHMVTEILNHESKRTEQNCNSFYKNVYYDAESDMNIRYEVTYEPILGENSHSYENTKMKKPKSKTSDETSKKEGYVVNSVARTRCGRISRPPRHVMRDYKRLKRLNQSNNDKDDENENHGGYADYRMNDDSTSITGMEDPIIETKSTTLFGPLEPSKRQFSSLSRCPTCDKIYLGYQRMAIHFQKYPEHKNEELLKHLLIRYKKRTLDEGNTVQSMKIDELSTNPDNTLTSAVPLNGTSKRKGRLHRGVRTRGAKSHLKELLTSMRIEDIIKYAAPVVATVLNSWEYLLLRSKRMKNDDQTLVVSLVKEIGIVLKQLRSLSRRLLKPCDEDKGNSQNTLMVEEEDVLQYVLGVRPGKYVTSENEDWAKEYSGSNYEVENVDIKEQYAALCSSTVNSDDVSELSNDQSNVSQRGSKSSFHQIVAYQRPTFTVTNLVQDIGKNPPVNSMTASSQHSILNNESLAYCGDSGCSKGNNTPSVNIPEASQLVLKSNDNSSLTVGSLDYIPSSFPPAHALNFEALVNDDLMNAFPISLPLLSDNSTDSKDYKDIFYSLKGIDDNDKSVIPDLGSTMSNIEISEAKQIHLLSTLKDMEGKQKTIAGGFKNSIPGCLMGSSTDNQLDDFKNIDNVGMSIIENPANVMPERFLESDELNLLDDLKTMGSSNRSCIVDTPNNMSTNLPESTNISCIMDFTSLDSNFS